MSGDEGAFDVVMTEERQVLPPVLDGDELDERQVRRTVLTGAATFAALLVAFWVWWPAGVALGLVAGCLAVFQLGKAMHATAQQETAVAFGALSHEDDLEQEFRRLRVRIGDDWASFGRAAALVTQAQWASVAGLQRELRMTTATAQRVMGLLEREGFVGPSRGTRPRVVRVPRDRAALLERLLGD